jgi:hypothetical protein
MTKRLLAIYLVLVVLLAAMVPSCGGGTGTINVQATRCGSPWTGNVSYTLTGPSTINGNNVSASFSSVATGNWTCGSVSGGPAGTFLASITPSATQSVSGGGTSTFTLNFELNQDAGITWIDWTRNGTHVTGDYITDGVVCNWIDAHFLQWVDGCVGYNVTLNETSWLTITQTGGNPGVQIFVLNETCAVNKTPAPLKKIFQMTSVDNVTQDQGYNTTLTLNIPTQLDVRTQWQLSKGTNYTKSINWFGISKAPFVPPGNHTCVLFELVLPAGPVVQYQFTLVTSAQVALVGSNDTNHANDSTTSTQLTLIVSG